MAHRYSRHTDGYAFRMSRKATQSCPPRRSVAEMATWSNIQASVVLRPGKNARWNAVNACDEKLCDEWESFAARGRKQRCGAEANASAHSDEKAAAEKFCVW